MGENAARIPTTYGGGSYGHLGLVTKPNLYFTLAGVNFVVPEDPGPYDINIPLRATAGERARLEKEHEKRKQEYDLCLAVSNVLKNQIVDAIKGPYLRELRDRRFGYLNSTPLDMLDHLFDRYGNLTAIDVQKCETRLNEPFNPDEPIAVYFQKLEDEQQISDDGGVPVLHEQLMQTALFAFY